MYKIEIEQQGKSYPYGISNSNFSKDESKITTKIKPLPKDSDNKNAEIEKGELILDPETGAIHKALGKPHSKGGTPVNLKDGSFVFSNFKDLAFNKQQKELFEFKAGGIKLKNNTPAKVLEKEVDLEHHNKMTDIIQNTKKYDALTNNSAKLMLLKNLEKAGQVAFLQESKKHTSIPEFAQNTAPIYSKDVDEKITQSMQYLQQGGRKLTEAEKILALKNKLADTQGWNPYDTEGPKSFFKKYREPYKGPLASNAKWKAFLNSPKGQAYTANQYGYTEGDSQITAPAQSTQMGRISIKAPQPYTPFSDGNSPGNPNAIVDPTNYNTKLTPWQKLNLAIPFYRAATVKTQYPLRQHQESVIPQFENQNVQPQLNANNQAYFNAANTFRTLNPTQASSYMQQLYGNRINANDQAIGTVQNNNIQIQNRQKELAASSLNQDAAQNRAFDSKFYDQTQTAVKNRDELKQAYEQQGVQGINETMTKKLAFDSWLNSQQQYRGKPTFIDKDGVQHYQGQTLYSPKANFFGYSVQHNPTNIDWQNYQSLQGRVEDVTRDQIDNLRTLFPTLSDEKLALFVGNLSKSKALQGFNLQLSQKKRGGKFIPNFRPKNTSY